MENVIVCSLDRNFVEISRVFLRSIAENFPEHPQIKILHSDLERDDVRTLESYPRVSCVYSNTDSYSHLPLMKKHGRLNPSVLYRRFLIFTEQFDGYDNVIFMDTDIVVRGDLSELCNSEEFLIFRDTYADFNDPDTAILSHADRFERELSEDGIGLTKYGANAGVFVVPRRYRGPAAYGELLSIAERYKDGLVWADQSVLNLWVLKKGLSVSDGRVFNFQARGFLDNQPPSDNKVIHFNAMDDEIRLCLMSLYVLLGRKHLATRALNLLIKSVFLKLKLRRIPIAMRIHKRYLDLLEIVLQKIYGNSVRRRIDSM